MKIKEKKKFFWEIKKQILNHLEGIIVLSLSILFTCLFYNFFLNQAYLIYSQRNLNETFIGLFGGLLGLLLTAYAIIFSIVPTLKKELLESDSFLRTNRAFFISVMSTLLLLVSSILYEFVDETIKPYFLLISFFLFSIVVMGLILISLILFLLLKISRKDVLSN